MKIIRNFDDYLLDLIIEAVVTKEAPLMLSDRFKNLLRKIDDKISKHFINNEHDGEHKSTYIDLDDSGLDKVSFIVTTKAVEVIADYKGLDKEKEISHNTFIDTKYNTDLINKLYSKHRSVTTIGRLVNKLFPDKFKSDDVQSFVLKFKSSRDSKDFELVDGDDIIKYYNENSYEEDSGTLGNSCMRYDECESYIEFYAENSNVVDLLILKSEKDEEKIKGRALVWKLSRPSGRTFMDRIYTIDDYDEELFKTYAKENGWLYKKRQDSSDSTIIVDTLNDTEDYMKLVVDGVSDSPSDQYPYMDTLKYYSSDEGTLTNDNDYFSGEYYELESTEGYYDERQSGIWVEYYGEYMNEDDLVYCELGDEYRTSEDAVYLDYYGEYATEEYVDIYMVRVDYYEGHDDLRKDRDTVDMYDSNETACKEYAESNLPYSSYYDSFIEPGKEVWSEYHETYLHYRDSVEVYLDEAQRKTDWRADDDGTWWEWDHDGEKYDENVTEEELREYNDLDEEDKEDTEE